MQHGWYVCYLVDLTLESYSKTLNYIGHNHLIWTGHKPIGHQVFMLDGWDTMFACDDNFLVLDPR
jgi:hypothetical protein